jgi:hypothetical protein
MGDPLKIPVSRGTNWTDLRFPITSTKVGGTKDPTFTKVGDNGAGSQGVFTYSFSQNQEQELYFVAQMPHSWLIGTDLDCHVHWGASDAGAGGVVWGLEYVAAAIDGDLSTTTIVTNAATASGTAKQNQYFDLAMIDTTGWELSQLFLCRVFRDVADGADDYGSGAFLYEIDFHFQQDSLGSQEEFLK